MGQSGTGRGQGMIYIYMDESGDLGFKKASSNVFVVSYITTNDPKILQRSLKKLRQRKLKKKMRELPEFKFYTASDRVKDLMFNKLWVLFKNKYQNRHP